MPYSFIIHFLKTDVVLKKKFLFFNEKKSISREYIFNIGI